jgi:MFS-type transporter involved in bile tolerance (Atg22 family)
VIGDLPSKYVAFERTLHLPTVKFLGGLFTVLSLEGLYGKNMGMSQYCASNLKNLCALDPSLSAIIMPFLLNALQPSGTVSFIIIIFFILFFLIKFY